MHMNNMNTLISDKPLAPLVSHTLLPLGGATTSFTANGGLGLAISAAISAAMPMMTTETATPLYANLSK